MLNHFSQMCFVLQLLKQPYTVLKFSNKKVREQRANCKATDVLQSLPSDSFSPTLGFIFANKYDKYQQIDPVASTREAD